MFRACFRILHTNFHEIEKRTDIIQLSRDFKFRHLGDVNTEYLILVLAEVRSEEPEAWTDNSPTIE